MGLRGLPRGKRCWQPSSIAFAHLAKACVITVLLAAFCVAPRRLNVASGKGHIQTSVRRCVRGTNCSMSMVRLLSMATASSASRHRASDGKRFRESAASQNRDQTVQSATWLIACVGEEEDADDIPEDEKDIKKGPVFTWDPSSTKLVTAGPAPT
jgi:hypothetical protein